MVFAMILVAGSDRDMKNVELGQIGSLVRLLPSFAGFDEEHLPATAQEFAMLVRIEDGVERTLRLVARALPPTLRETAYLLACEIAAIDGRAPLEELRVLQRLRVALGIDRLASAALERATAARFAVA
jgi:tellurite resistance protein